MTPRNQIDLLCDIMFGELFPSLPNVHSNEDAFMKAIPGIRKIYFNNKHTTVEWSDGVKTTVGCIEGQEFDEYSGFAAAVLKRLFGSSSAAVRFMNEHKEVQPQPIKKANAEVGNHA